MTEQEYAGDMEDVEELGDLERLDGGDDEVFMETPDNAEALDATPEKSAEITADTSVYFLRLDYSRETIVGAFSGEKLKTGEFVIVETRFGRDMARVTASVKQAGLKHVAQILRKAVSADFRKDQEHRALEEDAFKFCKERVLQRGIEMKLVLVHAVLEESKLLFFFTADGRVDFRDLVKDLVSTFRMRIELRQIGIRDEARITGGVAICGRVFCCNAISDKLKPVSIKMAKEQDLSLSSMKVSGPCGRLLCCIAYEHEYYNEQRAFLPNEGARVFFMGELWKVTESNVIAGLVCLEAADGRETRLPKSAIYKETRTEPNGKQVWRWAAKEEADDARHS
jgi:cell fate regulator YaaT (PSP1 superfamily)